RQQMPETMMRTTKTARLMLLSSAATIALMGSAMALDANGFVDRLAAFSEVYGYDFEFGAATLDGDTIVVDGFILTLVPSVEGDEPMVFDAEITFSGVSEGEDGSYTAEAVTIPDIDTEFATDPSGRLTL